MMEGGILSVALSLGSLPPDVIRHPALCSPDFPLPAKGRQRTLMQLASTDYTEKNQEIQVSFKLRINMGLLMFHLRPYVIKSYP